jgi:release factor glutamine methyltransferase
MVIPLDKRPRSGPYAGLNARSAKRFLTQAFTEAGLPFAQEDALEILMDATGMDKTSLMLRGAESLSSEVVEILSRHMNRRLGGEPVDHILGWREFFGRRFAVSRDVLSPRADTENLIRGALSRLAASPSPKILDLGTGSGAIGLTLLAESADAVLTATDISDAALRVAEKNADALNVKNRVTLIQGSWWDAVPQDVTFDIILSNPPYITDNAMEILETEVKAYDPDIALRGGRDGLEAYRLIVSGTKSYLEPGGWLGLEIGYDQADALRDLLDTEFWTEISVAQDLGGLDRVVWARKQL